MLKDSFVDWLKVFDFRSKKLKSKNKTNNKNRFILNKEIVEKNEIVDISKRAMYLAQQMY